MLAHHDLKWARDGYGNSRDYSIILKCQGTGSTLRFDDLSNSEPSYDFVTIEGAMRAAMKVVQE